MPNDFTLNDKGIVYNILWINNPLSQIHLLFELWLLIYFICDKFDVCPDKIGMYMREFASINLKKIRNICTHTIYLYINIPIGSCYDTLFILQPHSDTANG